MISNKLKWFQGGKKNGITINALNKVLREAMGLNLRFKTTLEIKTSKNIKWHFNTHSTSYQQYLSIKLFRKEPQFLTYQHVTEFYINWIYFIREHSPQTSFSLIVLLLRLRTLWLLSSEIWCKYICIPLCDIGVWRWGESRTVFDFAIHI